MSYIEKLNQLKEEKQKELNKIMEELKTYQKDLFIRYFQDAEIFDNFVEPERGNYDCNGNGWYGKRIILSLLVFRNNEFIYLENNGHNYIDDEGYKNKSNFYDKLQSMDIVIGYIQFMEKWNYGRQEDDEERVLLFKNPYIHDGVKENQEKLKNYLNAKKIIADMLK